MTPRFTGTFAVVAMLGSSAACGTTRSRAHAQNEASYAQGAGAVAMGAPPPAPMVARASKTAYDADFSQPAPAMAPMPGGEGGGVPQARPQDMLIVTGTVTVVAEDVANTVARVREHVRSTGGSVVSERIAGGVGNRPHGSMSLRLPPKTLDAFLEWLSKQGRIEERRLQTEDVSRTYFEQELALKNLELTARRLQDLMNTQAGNLNDVLAVERELTRVRGEIEQLKGSQRYLQDRVAQATIELQLRSKEDVAIVSRDPEMKFMLVPSLELLSFIDEQAEHSTRWGAGISLLFDRAFALDVKLFPARGTDARSVLASLSTATYSDFLGGGRRRYFNPYLGLALGGGRVNDRTTFTAGGEVGIELLRLRRFLLDTKARVSWFAADGPDQMVVSGTVGAGVPF